jgi:hypothetical protein
MPVPIPGSVPSTDGSPLVPEVVDHNMRHNSHLTMFYYYDQGVQSVTQISYLEFEHAGHRVTYILHPPGQRYCNEVVAIIASVDTILYHTVTTIGTMKAGFIVNKLFFRSYRLSRKEYPSEGILSELHNCYLI